MIPAPTGLTFVERVIYGFIFSTSLAVALAWSPLWVHLPDVTALMPASYGSVLETLPGAPNTALAFVVLLGLSYAALFLLREPTIGLGLIASFALGTAAYPYGHVRWHRLFVETPLDGATPTIAAWIRGLVPVLLLLVPAAVAHVRSVRHAYRAKGADDAEVGLVTRHLFVGSMRLAALSVGIALVLGLVIAAGSRFLTSETGILGRNPVVVMLVVAVLLVFALGVGTGLFSRGAERDDGSGHDDAQVPAALRDQR